MNKLVLLLIVVSAFVAVGCNSGDTPIETVKSSTPPPAPANPGQGLPNNASGLPQGAKDAISRGGG